MSSVLTVLAWTAPIFLPGIELLLLPVMFLLFLAGVSGFVTLSIGLFNVIRSKQSARWIDLLGGVAVGFYLGYAVLIPINDWDKRQRNLSGQILTESLDAYKLSHGKYPASLSDLDTVTVNNNLPFTYKLERFNYIAENEKFDLDIPIPIMDCWHWNNTEKFFEYSDF